MIKGIQKLLAILFLFCLMAFGKSYTVGKTSNTGLSFQIRHIPADYSSFKDTLLVLDPVKRHKPMPELDTFLRSTFETYYHGLYKMVGEREVYKYPADKYRYIFICNKNTTSSIVHSGTTVTDNTIGALYGLVDRANQKNQYQVMTSTLDHKGIMNLVIALDHARQGQ